MFDGIATEVTCAFIGVGMVFLTKVYASYAVNTIYITADGKRLGYQVHSFLGKPGRMFEVSLGRSRIVDGSDIGPVVISIEGFGKNFVVSDREQFYKNQKLQELLSISSVEATTDMLNESKAQRIEYYKDYNRKKKSSKY